ncbi:Coat F domain protein [compost metagenome]
MYNNQPSNQALQPNISNESHGGHEMFDCHEILGSFISLLDQYVLFEPLIQDQELRSILHEQHRFMTDLYNIASEAFSTGRKPSHTSQPYTMNQNNEVVYGIQKQTAPKKPMGSAQEVKDEGISSYMLGLVKSTASLLAMASLEITNPVVRRVMADSVPNLIEMGYELFLYQNKRQYYQVPQLAQQDMQQMLHSYAPSPYLT